MFKFEELQVYQEALELVDLVYDITKSWPKSELFCLTDQFRRASISIVLNIAEGSGKTNADFKRFLSTSRGSTFECVAIAQIAQRRKYISDKDYQQTYAFCLKLSKMLTALKNAI